MFNAYVAGNLDQRLAVIVEHNLAVPVTVYICADHAGDGSPGGWTREGISSAVNGPSPSPEAYRLMYPQPALCTVCHSSVGKEIRGSCESPDTVR